MIISLPRTSEFRLELRVKPHICRANREDFVANEALNTWAALTSSPIVSPEVLDPHPVFFPHVVLDFVRLDQPPNPVIVY